MLHQLVRSRALFPHISRSLSARALSDNSKRFSDPFPLSLQSNLDASPEFSERHPPVARKDESLQTMRARLVYQSRKRGILETDLLLSTFAGENLPMMSIHELREFDKLMDEPDWDIYYWAIGKRAPPERWAQSALLEKLKKHAANEGRVVRRMPDLTKTQ